MFSINSVRNSYNILSNTDMSEQETKILELLIHLYLVGGFTKDELRRYFGVDKKTILEWMRKAHISSYQKGGRDYHWKN